MPRNGESLLKRPGKIGTATKAASLIIVSLALLSCAPKKTVKVPPYEVTTSLLIEKISIDNVDTLMGASSIRIYKEEEYVAYLTGAMNYRKPDSFSITVFGPFGVTVMKMLIADETIEIYIPKKDTLYKTSLTIPFLLPDSEILGKYESSLDETKEDFIVTLFSPTEDNYIVSSRYYFDKETLNNYKVEKYNSERPVFTLLIDQADQNNLPIEFSVIAGNSRFEIKANNLTINQDLPERAFAHMRASNVLPIHDFLRALAPSQ
jgi:hypothetical protein